MLELTKIDLSGLAEALEDHSGMTRWFLDRSSGEVLPYADDLSEEESEEIDARDLIRLESFSSRDGYQDMEDFIALVRDPRARDPLERAIAGRGAFRRFKDTLFEFPDLREAWFRFHDARTERRAIEWLRDEELIDENEAARALAERAEDPVPPSTTGAAGAPPVDAFEVAGDVARDLAELYGERLRGV